MSLSRSMNCNRIFKEKESFTTLMESLYYSKDYLKLIHLSKGEDLVLFGAMVSFIRIKSRRYRFYERIPYNFKND